MHIKKKRRSRQRESVRASAHFFLVCCKSQNGRHFQYLLNVSKALRLQRRLLCTCNDWRLSGRWKPSSTFQNSPFVASVKQQIYSAAFPEATSSPDPIVIEHQSRDESHEKPPDYVIMCCFNFTSYLWDNKRSQRVRSAYPTCSALVIKSFFKKSYDLLVG